MSEQFSRITLAALNHILGGANWARERLKPFAGRQARMEMPPLTFGFTIDAEGWMRQSLDHATPDVTICLPAGTPLLLPQGLDKIMAGAQVSGNAEFATELSFVFRNLRWDAEEDLSKLLGDIVAHRLVLGANRFIAWQKQATRNLTENLAEYLAHENPLLVTTVEFTVFRDEITRLNSNLARLEGRTKTGS
jgi:ubiquinone biosynthesis protein UbiJ